MSRVAGRVGSLPAMTATADLSRRRDRRSTSPRRSSTPPPRSLAAAGSIDDHQVLAYDLAHAAAAVETAQGLLDYGAKGDVEGRITCAFVADAVADLAAKVFGREADVGRRARRARRRPRVPRHLPGRRVPRRHRPTPAPATSTATSRWCRTPSAASPTRS